MHPTSPWALYCSKKWEEWQPLAFFSQKLTSVERKYGVYGREMLAVYLDISDTWLTDEFYAYLQITNLQRMLSNKN